MILHRPEIKRIAVALSGGVDSAVVAALLIRQGFDVIALTMLLHDASNADDALSVALHLGIDCHVVDLRAQFASQVIVPFASDYVAGQTPIPCAVCNKQIKFGALVDEARKLGADALATGHYVRRIETPKGVEMHCGDDLQKDQSYFLYALSKEQLAFARFPLGEFSKQHTRQLAKDFCIPVSEKKDSQDICFVPCGDYVSVLKKLDRSVVVPGEIVDQSGKVLGHHDGVVYFTVGQRKGLNISDRVGDHNEPLFVFSLDAATNRVIVGPRQALMRNQVYLEHVNWLGFEAPSEDWESVTVRLRSSQKPVSARFYMEANGNCGRILLDEPIAGVASGQAGVLYKGTQLLGGGRICGSK